MTRFIYFFLLFAIHHSAFSQFDRLIAKAWEYNLQLKSQEFKISQSKIDSKEANALFGPTIGANLTYTLAQGGREIQFPIGDLLNPVYGTLNQITQTNNFPTLENQQINFLPNNFYDAKIRIQQSVYNRDLALNREAKLINTTLAGLEHKATQRYLAHQVMYYGIQIVSALEAIKIYDKNIALLDEAKRVTQSMIKNGIALPSALSRIQAQIENLTTQKTNLITSKSNASRYLYFLTKDSIDQSIITLLANLPMHDRSAGQREELSQMQEAAKLYDLNAKRENNFYIPKIGAQLDLGSQAFNFGWSPYALFGLNVDLSIFDNNRHKLRNQKNKLALDEHQLKTQYIAQQLEVQSDIAFSNLESALDVAQTYNNRIASSQKVYREVYTKYREGTANYLELIDAQTTMTNVEIQSNLARYQAWLAWSEYTYQSAAYKIN